MGLRNLGLVILFFLSNPSYALDCFLEAGAGYVQSNVITQNDWQNDPPAGYLGADCNWQTSVWTKPIIVVRLLHISNVLDGTPFNNTPESSLNYIGVGLRWKLTGG